MSAREIDLEEELAQARLSRTTLRRLAPYARRHLRPILIALVLEIPWVGTMLVVPHLLQEAIDHAIPAHDGWYLGLLALLMTFAIVIRATIAMVQITYLTSAGQRTLVDLRRAVFNHVLTLSMRYFDRTRHGRIIARIDRDVETLELPLIWGAITLTSSALMLAGVLAVMMTYDPLMALIVALTVPVLALVTRAFKTRGIAAYRQVREGITHITAHFAETITGVRVIQAFAGEARNRERFDGLLDTHNRQMIDAAVIWSGYVPAMGVVHALATLALVVGGGARVLSGHIDAGELAALVLLAGMFFRPIEALGDLYNQTLAAAAAAERIFLLLDTPPEVVDRPGARVMPRLAGEIRFAAVDFSYHGAATTPEQWAIRQLSFVVPAGSSAAFVGRTGAGKSSILNLVTRFYDVTGGAVLIDGVDVRDMTLASLHAQMGIVLQDIFLFRGTVLENIKFGRPTATDDEAIAAAVALGCDDIFRRLASGYATEVGDRGARLSEGERQLVSFTRAMLADPRILILDEATSAVDVLTEARIQAALFALAAHRTTLIVAHRLATVRKADLICVVDGGAIVEQGSHAQLLAAGGRYATMVTEAARGKGDIPLF